MQLHGRSTLSAGKAPDSPLSKETLECDFLSKFSTLTFDYYSEVSDLVQYISHFWDKMLIYSRNDPLMCLTFSSSLKGVASDWFYSMSLRFLRNFEEVTEVFFTQYASHREAKKNNHQLLSVKMR